MTNNRPFVPQRSYFGVKYNTTFTINQYEKITYTSTGQQQQLGCYQDTTAGSVNGFFG
jgi:hypothetical protein